MHKIQIGPAHEFLSKNFFSLHIIGNILRIEFLMDVLLETDGAFIRKCMPSRLMARVSINSLRYLMQNQLL
jgi:hypothetical protein